MSDDGLAGLSAQLAELREAVDWLTALLRPSAAVRQADSGARDDELRAALERLSALLEQALTERRAGIAALDAAAQQRGIQLLTALEAMEAVLQPRTVQLLAALGTLNDAVLRVEVEVLEEARQQSAEPPG